MNFNEPTSGDRRTAGRGEAARGGLPAERPPVSNPPEHEAGRDRCSGGSKLPHVGERWRHLRTGIEAEVLWRYEDSLLTSAGGTVWPIDLFCAKWVRA
jgi:hypothetical protein